MVLTHGRGFCCLCKGLWSDGHVLTACFCASCRFYTFERRWVLCEPRSDLLERLSSSCLSLTVDLSSSSHISTLIRWEFLITMGTSSNMFSKPMLAFFKLKMWGTEEAKSVKMTLRGRMQKAQMILIQLIQHYINLAKGRDYRHSEKIISDKRFALFFFLVCLITEK